MQQLLAKSVVNAAGPWVGKLLDKVSPPQESIDIDLVQGTHIILPIELGENIYYIESPVDGRPVFVMPWYGDTMIGTTELMFEQDPDETKPTNTELNICWKLFIHIFLH